MMSFLIYANLDNDELKYNFDESLRAQDILGTVTTQKSPVAEASTREHAIERAYSLLGQHPMESYYVVDVQGNLLKSTFVAEFSELRSRWEYWRFQAIYMFLTGTFCILLTAAAIHSEWKFVILFFLLAGIEFVLSRTYNIVEGTVVFLIIMTLIGSFLTTDRRPPKENRASVPVPSSIQTVPSR